ncbi:uncharacterized protein [Oryza sativa Japonica Group]|jgi:hypothetical protein|uniref:Expressed protein n=7 Tax=Oryza TaxID=4527 RepID=Q10NZ3_ORYSJ|nr:uncharacterized protein LOC4332279 [Oryza sativa Japonica Group]XP_052148565.1 uncharacterized protein LOC127767317 [Oryza glaberrima]EAY89290.1 hypothetical protein OsI_10790 [Oryza sativa Indica Group]KAB8091119.1 hypothetical protein EE612_016543 [Oryza sativa]ABF95012.1 expressed protein [Oryza sativa Japonica Group]EAZ20982.1 hypothetical protein OsJ_36634 [Oryza sativa Japonica Group]KAF2938382.1 hypothetical protein DAI22_03g114400 [Oryza sativa Japonica Group]|eukprot:NP_001049581.1 Os03g0253600 [Oryza sativa Japonica Group]
MSSYDQMLAPLLGAGRSAWTAHDGGGGGGEAVVRQILKCTRWQLEETTDFVTCPYHYYCDSSYPGDYHAAVGVLVAAFAAYCFLSTLAFTVLDLARSGGGGGGAGGVRGIRRKYLLPSGPFLLPLVLLVLAKGQRINAVFPLAQLGPALLLLLQASALAFRNEADGDIRYAVLEASTVSGVLHASLYLDAVVLPYYTGLEALRWSQFSGECATCLCRMEPLVVGGTAVRYRGLSKTALAIIFALCSRMVCRIYGEERLSAWTRSALEAAGWVFVAADAVYLVGWVAIEGGAVAVLAYSLVAGLVFLSVFGKVYRFLAWLETRQSQWKSSLCHSAV